MTLYEYIVNGSTAEISLSIDYKWHLKDEVQTNRNGNFTIQMN